MQARPSAEPSDLLPEYAGVLQRLAHRLVHDEHQAEDLLQETRIAAWQRTCGESSSARGWLTGTVRHLASNLARSEERRRRRERAVARPETSELDDPSEMHSSLEIQRLLADSLQSLEEPLRRTIYLRFYRDLQPREIAARLEVPVETVKTRLRRGLEKLRRRLDEASGGDRAVWCAALAPWLETSPPLAAGTSASIGKALLGGLLMKTELVGIALALSVGFGAWQLVLRDGPAVAPADALTLASEQELARAWSAPQPDPEPRAKASSLTESPMVASAAAPGWTFRGTVRSDRGNVLPHADVDVLLHPSRDSVAARTAADGSYRLFLPWPQGLSTHAESTASVRATASGHGEQMRSHGRLRVGLESSSVPREQAPAEIVTDFTLERQTRACGRVQDEAGLPLADLAICAVDGEGRVTGSARSDARGEFAVEWSAAAAWIVAGSSRTGLGLAGPFESSATDVDVEVGSVTVRACAGLAGVVTFPDGTPVAETAVSLRRVDEEPGERGALTEAWLNGRSRQALRDFRTAGGCARGETRTDERGRFVLAGLEYGSYELEFPQLEDRPRAGPFATGELAQVVVDGYRIHVSVRDTQGLPIPGARLSMAGDDYAEIASTAGLTGSQTFAVAPGTVSITASLLGAAPASARIDVQEGVHEYEVELVLDFDPLTGELFVLVEDEQGSPIHDFTVHLVRSGSPTLVPELRGLRPDAGGRLPPLPVGEYEVRVTFGHGTWDGELPYTMPVTGKANVASDSARTIRLKARTGGRLALDLRAIDPEADEKAGVALELIGAHAGAPRRIHTFIRPGGRVYGGAHLGARGISEIFEAGGYELHARAPGFRSLIVPVDVRRGETTAVELDFERP